MSMNRTSPNPSAFSGAFHLALQAALLLGLIFGLTPQLACAGSAIWQTNPSSGDWNDPNNWVPNTVPNGRADRATFISSSITGVELSTDINLDRIVFQPGASAYTISTAINTSANLSFGGAGIVNNSAVEQNFVINEYGAFYFRHNATAGNAIFTTYSVTGPTIFFLNSASAGDAVFHNEGGVYAGTNLFLDSSTAANATFFNEAGGGNGAGVEFYDRSTAGNATFYCAGGTPTTGQNAGFVYFNGRSNAGNAVFVADGASGGGLFPAFVTFYQAARARNATIIANGGTVEGAYGGDIAFTTGPTAADNATLVANGGMNGGAGGAIGFFSFSSGGRARVKVYGNGLLSIPYHHLPGVSLGSLEGDGDVILGANNLTVGKNDLNTTFSGNIQDGDLASGGSLTKVGTGTFILASANTYTGPTTVTSGVLELTNSTGSATGTGAVQVNAGSLGGTGTIAAAVTVGTGTGAGAFLAPSIGAQGPATLTIQSPVTFHADGTYTYKLDSTTLQGDTVVAKGVTIDTGARFFFGVVTGSLPAGSVFTLIDNTAVTPIAGNFSNLADGWTFSQSGNKFQVDYEGGDGNDLTLTVVP
jgi:autotransporter-associated beta strand protein